MAELATTRLSSKGQVVIPEDVRQRLGLKAGDQFIVVGEGDVVILAGKGHETYQVLPWCPRPAIRLGGPG